MLWSNHVVQQSSPWRKLVRSLRILYCLLEFAYRFCNSDGELGVSVGHHFKDTFELAQRYKRFHRDFFTFSETFFLIFPKTLASMDNYLSLSFQIIFKEFLFPTEVILVNKLITNLSILFKWYWVLVDSNDTCSKLAVSNLQFLMQDFATQSNGDFVLRICF